MKFKAKAIMTLRELEYNGIPHNKGFVVGYLLGDIIVSDYLDIEEGCISFDWWAKVDKKTIEFIKEEK